MNGPAIIGAGRMAAEHLKAMRALGLVPSTVVGRSPARARAFEAEHGVSVGAGLSDLDPDASGRSAIVAVSHESLAEVTLELLRRGFRHILLEKPGALTRSDLERLNAAASECQVYVAYNRRFYPWVGPLADQIEADGGLVSCHFEFTEWERAVLAEGVGQPVLDRWGIVNSSHCIDLALLFSGEPASLHAVVRGQTAWHPAGAVFAGSGLSEDGVVLSYASNWTSAGRWRIDLSTSGARYILAPFEKPQVQKRYELETTPFDFPQPESGELKMGLVEQMRAFLEAARGGPNDPRLCTLEQQLARWPLYEKIFGYDG